MKQASFTARELFGMAYLLQKRKMYGIPNVVGDEPALILQDVLDGLVAKGIATMNIDGQITLRSEYCPTVNTCCDCQKCLTVNTRAEDRTEHSYIFWSQGSHYMMAEALDDQYVFSQTDAIMVGAIIGGCLCDSTMPEQASAVIIPQLDIVKAKRACTNGDYAGASRLLRQRGAPSHIEGAIVAGLQEHSYYLGLVYMDMLTGSCQKQDLSYICSDGILLSLGQTVANLRTCATFTPTHRQDMHNAVMALVNNFLEKEA